MTRTAAIAEALRESATAGVALAVVFDRYAEDREEPFGYAPLIGLTRLYPGGTVIGWATAKGTFLTQ